jgi:hypothetical protein
MIIEACARAARTLATAAAALCIGAFASATAHAADIRILNGDEPGMGFNDPTPVAPVGGNSGRTLGEQRQIVFQFVADFWGRRLRSDVPVEVLAGFIPLDCDSTGAALAGAAPLSSIRDFPNAQRAATWYPAALANKLAGAALIEDPDPFVSAEIFTVANVDLGKPGCLDNSPFYLGLDGKGPPEQVDLLTTMLHELGHGLGFQTFTRGETGRQRGATPENPNGGFPSIWDHFLFDAQQGKNWVQMTFEERLRSAVTPLNLLWSGQRVANNAPRVLERGVPDLYAAGNGLNKFYLVGPAQFGPPIDEKSLTAAPLARVVDQPDGRGFACTPLDATNAAAVRNRVAIIDRGGCAFVLKVKNAQDAGAKAVLIADNAAGPPQPAPLAGVDATIVIPSARLSQTDGAEVKAAVSATRPPFSAAYAVLFENPARLVGTDRRGRPYMFTPAVIQIGSSVSHYDVGARPNLLMEPFAEPGQPIAVSAPQDLTLELLRDIGW